MSQHHSTPGAPSGPPDPLDAGDATSRLTTLAHELSNILDGSLRCAHLALRTLPNTHLTGVASAPEAELRARLETIERSLQRMSDLVRRVASPALSAGALAAGPMLDALTHAAQVARASIRSDVHGASVVLEDHLDPNLARAHAGEVYAVALNALRNALDAMARRADRSAPGRIIFTAGYFAPGMIRIEVVDDGPGLEPALDPARAMHPGVSTKPGSAGVGLALAARIVHAMGGRLALAPRAPRGAVFIAEFPEPRDWGAITLGNATPALGEGRNA